MMGHNIIMYLWKNMDDYPCYPFLSGALYCIAKILSLTFHLQDFWIAMRTQSLLEDIQNMMASTIIIVQISWHVCLIDLMPQDIMLWPSLELPQTKHIQSSR